tara:strand:- start:214 stop:876 length:663 start_codon:yes stop_codon:yes gene_type:complete
MQTKKIINDYTFYKIININGDINLCYVGSTANFKERVRAHRNNSKTLNTKLYTTIRVHGGWCEFKMVPIGTKEQLSFTQARVIEEEYRIKLKAELNSQKCFRTDEEKKEDYKENNDKRKEERKEYCENNKEKIAQHHREWREKNKEQLVEKKQKYYLQNKERITEYKKEYYLKQTNQEQLKIIVGETVACECGCVVKKYGLSAHKQTQKHIKFINNISNN